MGDRRWQFDSLCFPSLGFVVAENWASLRLAEQIIPLSFWEVSKLEKFQKLSLSILRVRESVALKKMVEET